RSRPTSAPPTGCACRPPWRCRARGSTCPAPRRAESPCAGTPPRRAGAARSVPAIRYGHGWFVLFQAAGGPGAPPAAPWWGPFWGPPAVDASIRGATQHSAGRAAARPAFRRHGGRRGGAAGASLFGRSDLGRGRRGVGDQVRLGLLPEQRLVHHPPAEGLHWRRVV